MMPFFAAITLMLYVLFHTCFAITVDIIARYYLRLQRCRAPRLLMPRYTLRALLYAR